MSNPFPPDFGPEAAPLKQTARDPAGSDSATPPASPALIYKRRTPLAVRGEPMLWLTGMALTASLLMIVALLTIVVANGFATFWPRDIHEVRLTSGELFLGAPIREEAYDPGPERLISLRTAAEAGSIPPGSLDENGRPIRRLYRVGNKEVTGSPFRWVNALDIASIEEPTNAALFERTGWGPWLGVPEAILLVTMKTLPEQADGELPLSGMMTTARGEKRFERDVIERSAPDDEADGGKGAARVRVVERVFLSETAEQTWAMLPESLREAERRRDEIRSLNKHAVGAVNRRLERARLDWRTVEILHARGRASDERLEQAEQVTKEKQASLQKEYDAILERIHALEAADDEYRIIIRDPASGAIAPRAQTEPGQPMRLSQIVRAVRTNDLGFTQKLRVYLDRWWEFIAGEPREANTEGGVFPVIFGTVMLTILLSVIVVPLGVVAALYLREYAKQGVVNSAVRIAINNLAGVPSIVYGVFGLGFFCYTLGSYIDNGPTNTWPVGLWWLGAGGAIGVLFAAAVIASIARPTPGKPATWRDRALHGTSIALWIIAFGIVIALFANTPFFSGFFPARTTFGTKGILWSSLTLALLTLPVVVVATEEAISSVPGSLRQGSYGCGASKWQTIRRIILPSAMPGIMTGMILAIARGAGEVAPLMLVGAVKLAPELPIEPIFPFLHLERSFMHLGFHIYDVGFQSPDAEAARPVVWTTTLLLILVVVALNLAAISLRARMRRRARGGAF